jgi:hypothetical protein
MDAQASRLSQVDEALRVTGVAIERLEKQNAELVEKLAKVLTFGKPKCSPENIKCGVPVVESCLLAKTIDGLSEKIKAQNDLIEDLISRIEL